MEEEKYITKKGEEINIIIDSVKDDFHSDDWSIIIDAKEVMKKNGV